MRRTVQRVCVTWCIVLVAVLGYAASWAQADSATVFQVSTFDALKRGLYEGQISFGDVKKHGNFGLGTVNGLDGEMVAVDGEFYQVRADGKAYPIADSAKTPFAVVASFRGEQNRMLQRVPDLGALHKALDALVTCRDKLYAFRIDGLFKKLKVRSVPRQKKPYPTLETALKHQEVFDLSNVQGSLVGYYCPKYMDGVNLAGYHFHFITADRQAGGHVLDCDAEGLAAQVMMIDGLSLTLLNDCGEASAGAAAP